MVDIHSHILWEIDDGSKNKDMTIKMLKEAVENGTTKIIATPHYTRGYFEVPYKTIISKFKELQRLIVANKLNIEVYLGQEVYYRDNIIGLYEEGVIGKIQGTDYMLLELPMREFNLDKILDNTYELQIKGVKLILAHPERYIPFIKNPDLINRFIEEGFLFQLNAGSLTGNFNKDVEKLADKYLKSKIYSFIGSDAHNESSRTTNLSNAINIINNKNQNYIDIFNINGETLLKNGNVEFIGDKIEKGNKNKERSLFAKLFNF